MNLYLSNVNLKDTSFSRDEYERVSSELLNRLHLSFTQGNVLLSFIAVGTGFISETDKCSYTNLLTILGENDILLSKKIKKLRKKRANKDAI